MNLTELILKLREEARKISDTPNYLRIAADMIEHLQEERNGLVETNAKLQKTLFMLGDKLCACESQIPCPGEEGQCAGCKHIVSCPLEKMALFKFGFKECPEYKGAKG